MRLSRKLIKIICGLVILGLLYIMILHFLIKSVEDEIPLENAQYMIVLGARLYGDYPSPALRERLHSAFIYLMDNPATKVIVSGGQGSDELIPEAEAMKIYLTEMGINHDRILVETMSTSTYENIKNSISIIKDNNEDNPTIVIVTNKFHLFRVYLLAKRQGQEVSLLGAEIPPSILFSSYFREYFALTKSIIFDF